MTTNERNGIFLAVVLGIALIILAIILGPSWIRARNAYRAELTVAHYETDLATIVRLEDQARATVSQWVAAYTRYLQFRDSEDREERNWGNAAQMQANNLAATFNTFMLEHSAVWIRGVPEGLQERLPLLPLPEGADTPWPIAEW